jgi:hypothetical protein
MSTSPLLEANDIVWELVTKPFSAQQTKPFIAHA